MRSPLPLACLLSGAAAAVMNYEWTLVWKLVSPDGFTKPVISVNDKWLPPKVKVTVGDYLNVTVTNNLGNETASILRLRGYQHARPGSSVSGCSLAQSGVAMASDTNGLSSSRAARTPSTAQPDVPGDQLSKQSCHNVGACVGTGLLFSWRRGLFWMYILAWPTWQPAKVLL
jgi:hypothetical protein